ncbi:MAG TPA: hypothetical protein VFA28_15450 [Bryobacteraceae bacterium]|nr:hypothetical protein [Bryobacteraceae bacterium]
MADKYGFCVEIGHGLLAPGCADEFIEPLEFDLLTGAGGDQRGLGRSQRSDKRHALKIRSMVPGGLGSDQGKLGGDVFDGKIAAAFADAAAFEQITGEEPGVGADPIAGDFLELGEGGGRRAYNEEGLGRVHSDIRVHYMRGA